MILAVALLSLIYFQPSFWNEPGTESMISDGLGDGRLIIPTFLYNPHDVLVGGGGIQYLADYGNNRILTLDDSGNITTMAGNGLAGFGGDGGPAIQASVFYPHVGSLDTGGNLYIADSGNHRIRKIDGLGIITTVAGNGHAGFAGDGWPATKANFTAPNDVKIDSAGNLYIADTGNHRIREVDALGIITTVAGNGVGEFLGDDGPATRACLHYPFVITLDNAGNLYITDSLNHRVRRMDREGIITTVAGDGVCEFHGDGGPATCASLNYPIGMTVDDCGNLYIADTDNHRVRKVDSRGIITTVAGNGYAGFSGDGGPAVYASLNYPRGLSMDNLGNLYIADSMNNRIRKMDHEGIITTVVWNGYATFGWYGGSATIADTNYP